MLKKRADEMSLVNDLSIDTHAAHEYLSENDIGSLQDNRTIFVKLREGKVHFVSSTKNLYFVDSPDIPVSEMIRKVFKGLNQIPDIQQCYLDQHSFFKGAFCMKLNESQHEPVLVALRLQGIVIKITKTAISGEV